jgi:hypothetical protein
MGNKINKLADKQSVEKSDKKHDLYIQIFNEELSYLLKENGMNNEDLNNPDQSKTKTCNAHVLVYNRFSKYNDQSLQKFGLSIGLLPNGGEDDPIIDRKSICDFIYNYIEARVQLIQLIRGILDETDNCMRQPIGFNEGTGVKENIKFDANTGKPTINYYELAKLFKELYDKSIAIESNESNGSDKTNSNPPLSKNIRDSYIKDFTELYNQRKNMFNLIDSAYDLLENTKFSIKNKLKKLIGKSNEYKNYEYVPLNSIKDMINKIDKAHRSLLKICKQISDDGINLVDIKSKSKST